MARQTGASKSYLAGAVLLQLLLLKPTSWETYHQNSHTVSLHYYIQLNVAVSLRDMFS